MTAEMLTAQAMFLVFTGAMLLLSVRAARDVKRLRSQLEIERMRREPMNAKVDELLGRWESETAHLSSISRMEHHQAFQELLTIPARIVVPRLIERFRAGHLGWIFGALRQLTGAQPVREEHAGKIKEMAADWINWYDNCGGREQVMRSGEVIDDTDTIP